MFVHLLEPVGIFTSQLKKAEASVWGNDFNSQEALQCGAPKIAKLVYNSNNYGL
jgi:hypothetical protein